MQSHPMPRCDGNYGYNQNCLIIFCYRASVIMYNKLLTDLLELIENATTVHFS